ncbi:MAG: acid--CoA ligase [Candidatus Aminicenantes bacterium]|nr:acid--CoA ligase [Candidatus Aminicenantes bacterium]
MKIVAFITDYAVVDKIIRRLKLTFTAERPPPPQAQKALLRGVEERGEYF